MILEASFKVSELIAPDHIQKIILFSVFEKYGVRLSDLFFYDKYRTELFDRKDRCERARLQAVPRALAELLSISADHLRSRLDRLYAAVYMPDSDHDRGVRTLHASFGDFLFRRAPETVRLSVYFGHQEMVHGCLQRMAWEVLCFNVSRSSSSFEPNPTGMGVHA